MKSGKMTTLPDEIALDQAYDYDERAIVFDGINSCGQICFSKRGWSIYCSYRLLTRLSHVFEIFTTANHHVFEIITASVYHVFEIIIKS